MAEQSVQRDFKFTKAEKEKEQQAAAREQLYFSYILPNNISDMKSFAFGSFTWRDVIAMGGCELIPIAIMMAFSALIPQWLCAIIGAVIGLPFAFLSIKHIFTGDLPIEERIKISLDERGQLSLLNWDKTKQGNGSYVETSTQSFVPQLEFTEDKFTFLPRSQGGLAIIELAVDDMTQAKDTDMLGVVRSFKRMLDALIQDTDCTPIQIMLKSVPKNLREYIEKSEQRASEIELAGHHVAAARAQDYSTLLMALDQEKAFHYRYYIIITYREDAEHVGEETMNSASVKRQKIKEKGLNPLNKRAKAAQQADFKVGMTEEERKQMLKERNKESEFGPKKTQAALERRVSMCMNMIRDLGSTHTAVKPRLLDKHEIAKLIFECYNTEDKNVINNVLEGALDVKTTLHSQKMYTEFPDIFVEKKKDNNRTLSAQKAGALTSQDNVM